MTKRVEIVLIVLTYVLVAYLSAIFLQIACWLDFWSHPEQCVRTGFLRIAIYGSLIFWIPTYHFGLKGWLKMGMTFLGCCFIWLVAWLMIREITRLNEFPVENAFSSQALAAVPVAALYLLAYRSEWRKNTNITRATWAE